MEILRNLEQIYDKINNIFSIQNKDFLADNNFVFEIAPYEVINELKNNSQDTVVTQQNIDDLFSLVFQLNEYTAIVCNLTHLFLVKQLYNEVYGLVSKIFVSHIGIRHYKSEKATQFSERNFDRFIEIVKTANIKNEVYIPFLLEIYKCLTNKNYAKWKNPALEFLQNFFTENENWLIQFVEQNPDLRYKTYGAILDFNTNKGVEYLIKDYMHENSNKEECTNLLKNYKRDVLFYIDTEMPRSDAHRNAQLLEVLLSMDEDTEVMARIQDIYSTTKNEEIKNTISNRLGISETLNIRSEKQFLYAVRRKIKEPQERTMGVGFDKFNLKFYSGEEATNSVYTFIIYLFKEEKNLFNLPKLSVLEKIFEKQSLYDFATQIFEIISSKPDILQAKWSVRLFSLFANQALLSSIFNYVTILLKQGRNKESKYILLCLINSHKFEVIDFIKSLLEENSMFAKDNLSEFVVSLAKSFNMHEDDIQDMLVTSDFSVGEFDIQRDRLYNAFISGKMYSKSIFTKLFIENSIYNKLAQNLIFGEYRFNRLNNAFIIVDKHFEFLVGKTIFENDAEKDADILIGLIHPLDCDFKFEKIFNYFPNPTFNQFKQARFDSRDYNLSISSVNRFVGVMINTKPFIKYLTTKGFIPNKNEDDFEYKSLVYQMPSLNLFCELEFEKFINDKNNYNSLSYILFYKLSDTLKAQGKFITQKSNAIPISSIPERFFDFILTMIYEGSKMM